MVKIKYAIVIYNSTYHKEPSLVLICCDSFLEVYLLYKYYRYHPSLFIIHNHIM